MSWRNKLKTNRNLTKEGMMFRIKRWELGKTQIVRFTSWITDVGVWALVIDRFFDYTPSKRDVVYFTIIGFFFVYSLGRYFEKHWLKVEAEYGNKNNFFVIEMRNQMKILKNDLLEIKKEVLNGKRNRKDKG